MHFPIVEISDGKVQGSQRVSIDGKPFYSFLGIPYAKPPVGRLRFKAPQPLEPWEGVRDATKEGDSCYQLNFKGEPQGSEDCLNLNVFTRALPLQTKRLKPVLVFIHGGAFIVGSNKPSIYGPEHLMLEDVVLVTINYRLGFLGFLSAHDTSLEVPGNAGLKDQVLALEWVQKNIQHFSGDKNNVTIFGESAGGASVHFHVLSLRSRGLFHKAIMQSGVALNPWALSRRHLLDFASFSAAERVDGGEREALEILRGLSVEELLRKQAGFVNRTGIISPTIEQPNATEFLTASPVEILNSGMYNKVPIMLGYCNNEGLLFQAMTSISRATSDLISMVDPDMEILEDFIPTSMKVLKGSSASQEVCKKFWDFYFCGDNADDKHLFPTDYHFVIDIIQTAKIHAKSSQNPVFLYRMSLDGNLNFMKKIYKLNKYPGASHTDDLGYLFKIADFPDTDIGDRELVQIKRFVELWTNFAKFGNPTPKSKDFEFQWRPVDGNSVHFLDIGDELCTAVDPEGERMKFWKEIYQLSPLTCDYL